MYDNAALTTIMIIIIIVIITIIIIIIIIIIIVSLTLAFIMLQFLLPGTRLAKPAMMKIPVCLTPLWPSLGRHLNVH